MNFSSAIQELNSIARRELSGSQQAARHKRHKHDWNIDWIKRNAMGHPTDRVCSTCGARKPIFKVDTQGVPV